MMAVFWYGFTDVVGPDQFAIKQIYLGPDKGVKADIYGPGMHFVVPG